MLRKPANLLLAICFIVNTTLPQAVADEQRLPEIGDPSGSIITPAQEQRLGQAFMRSVRKSVHVMSDPLMAEYIQSLGTRLASHSPSAGQIFNFFLIDDPQINAFAGPAGHIGIYTGLILTTETESELASVIAHEISHVSQKHLVRTFDAASRMSLPMAALLLAAIIAGTQSDSDIGHAAHAAIQAGFLQHQINFTRTNEKEADSVGIQILAEAGFEPSAMPVFFERMGRASRFYGSELPEFLRTHPVTTNRIADSRGRAEAYPYRHYPDDIHYHLLRATLREKQFTDPKEAVLFFKQTLADGRYRNEAAQRYGYVLALMRAREFNLARTELDKLLKDNPQEIAYLITSARLFLKAEETDRALAVLKSSMELHSGNYPLTITYAQTLLDAGNAQTAHQILEDLTYSHPHNTSVYKLLAQASGAIGNINQAHQYQAEYYYLQGDLEPAAQQLEIALQNKEISLYRSARMAARLKDIREEINELKKPE